MTPGLSATLTLLDYRRLARDPTRIRTTPSSLVGANLSGLRLAAGEVGVVVDPDSETDSVPKWRDFDSRSLEGMDVMNSSAKLIFLCGKMAAGKSTLARDLGKRENAILLVQDEFLDALFPGEITDIPGFVKCSSRLKNALTPHICDLLSKGISVVLDFPGNTKVQRAWFRELIERANVEHELHFVDVSDALCKGQLADRSKSLPAGAPWTTEAEFAAITACFGGVHRNCE